MEGEGVKNSSIPVCFDDLTNVGIHAVQSNQIESTQIKASQSKATPECEAHGSPNRDPWQEIHFELFP